MGCIVLCRTYHTAPDLGQGPPPIVPQCFLKHGPGPGPGTGHSKCDLTTTVENGSVEYSLAY